MVRGRHIVKGLGWEGAQWGRGAGGGEGWGW